MKVLQLHNFYRDPRGGESAVVEDEHAILEAHGHEVLLLSEDNQRIKGFLGEVGAGFGAVYSVRSKKRVKQEIRAFKPDIVHVHNIYPLLTPSIFYACREGGVPVVMTLHNYRLCCPSGQLLRDGRVCEDCLGKRVAWPGLMHSCYRGSRGATASVVMMNSVHGMLDTWRNAVDGYVVPSRFALEKLVQAGLPEDRIHVKPHFLIDHNTVGSGQGGYALYAGRFSFQKGIDVMLTAWDRPGVKVPLKLVGDGALSSLVAQAQLRNPKIEWLGWRPRAATEALMREASFLVVPSTGPEPFGLVVIEAFAGGTPVLASGTGAFAEMVRDGEDGLLFRPGDADDLARVVCRASADPSGLQRMRGVARAEFEAKYTAEPNYQTLMSIYDSALKHSAAARSGLAVCR